MEFNKSYNRQEFMSFLQNTFLPEDFIPSEEKISFSSTPKYSTRATRLGCCESLDLVVYEIYHNSKHDARVSLSKEAFRMLSEEFEDRALVLFVPENDQTQYRFSFIEITLHISEDGKRIHNTYSNPHRYSYLLGEGIAYHTPNKFLNVKGRVIDDKDLHDRFSVEVLTKEFYTELSDWYAWAITIIRFPNDINTKDDDSQYNHEGAIRLITRLIFVWFLKQRNLIPDEFFDEQYLSENLLKDFDPNLLIGLFQDKSYESIYYKAILQNLFFAMLNSPIVSEKGNELTERHFRREDSDYDNNKLMRYEYYFKDPQLFVDLANHTVPFLNGGLFDCLDDKDNGLYYDGFSDKKQIRDSLVIPDFLFFGEEAGKNIDLSEWYGDRKKKKVSARGIIDILKRYNFTVEENTPFDKEVSLDPELLGKVFENLLASFNPETKTTARKQTGSFYTPREIVQYMVDESLVSYLKNEVDENLEPEFRSLLQYSDEKIDLTEKQCRTIISALYNCKILDPACGSGAFPMGILQQMVHILNRIDENNDIWKEMMLKLAIDETSDAYQTASNDERKHIINEIEHNFDENINRPDYARKLYLIENCIYGVDIQPIAIQISKLRFFISLVVDQNTNSNPLDNFGIRPLPNLEAKFVAANTLIGLKKREPEIFDSELIQEKENQLKIAKHKIFGAKTVRTKRKYRKLVNDLRTEISNLLKESGAIGNYEARQLASWDMFDQNSSSPFFDPEWMFGVKNGFNIIIANPPYVSVKGLSSKVKDSYRDLFFTAQGRFNLFCLFIEKGHNLLKNGGILTYIQPEGIFTNIEYRFIREFIVNRSQILKISLFDYRVFEAAVDTAILSICKRVRTDSTFQVLKNLKEISIPDYNQSSITDKDDYLIKVAVSQEHRNLVDKIQKQGKDNLGNLIEIQQGIIYTGSPKEDIFSNYPKTSLFKKCLDGRDIKKWYINWDEKIDNKYIEYTSKLHRPREERLFTNPEKILLPRKATSLSCGYDDNQFYALNTAYVCLLLPSALDMGYTYKYILALLNSKLLNYYYKKVYLGWQITIPALNSLPIVLDKARLKTISSIVEAILTKYEEDKNSDINELERQLDAIIFRVFNITFEEAQLIDPSFDFTSDEYGLL